MHKLRLDYIYIALILLLTLLGLVTLNSASYLTAINQARFEDGWAPLLGNLLMCAIMLVGFPFMALMPLKWLQNRKVVIFLLFLTVIVNMIPPLISLIQHKNSGGQGSSIGRWIVIRTANRDFSFQPSELIKIMLPLYLAYIFDRNKDRPNSFAYRVFPPAIITALFCGLVLWQSNYSEAVLIFAIGLVICFVAGIHLKWICLGLFLPVPFVYVLITLDKGGRWYERWLDFLSGPNDQVRMSLNAIKEGGFWGKGIGQGTLKTKVPEVHGDFVFASYAEESGLLGIIFFLFLIGAFIYIGYLTAYRSQDRFRQLLAFGLITPIAIQTLVNIAVVVFMIPTTGIPLPFVSSGGSALLATLIASGLLVNLTRNNVKSDIGGLNVR